MMSVRRSLVLSILKDNIMSNFNQWIGEGNISCDPELRFTHDSSRPVTNFNLFVDNTYKSKKGVDEAVMKKRSSRIPVVAWAAKAEAIARNFKKGDKVRVVGHIRTRLVEKDGITFNSFEIVAEEVTLIRRYVPREDDLQD